MVAYEDILAKEDAFWRQKSRSLGLAQGRG